jgi:iron complex transport system substrate-binding protein
MKRIIIAGIVLSLLSAGCTQKGVVTQTTSESIAENNFTPLVFDNYGRTVTVKTAPRKVLTLGPNCTETFVALGLGDYIIGTSMRNHSRGPLPEYADVLTKIPDLNYSSATREAVIGSGADFIYGIDWEFGGSGLDVAELEKFGMTVYMNSATTFEQMFQEIRDIGKIFAIEDRAEAFIADQNKRLSAVEHNIAGKSPVKVLVYDSGNDGVFTCSGVNFENLIISAAGGNNIFSDLAQKAWVTVSYEEVLARDPEVIIIHDYDSPSVEAKIAEIKSNRTMAQLAAVQNDRFVTITLESVLPGDRIAYAVEKLYGGFYE